MLTTPTRSDDAMALASAIAAGSTSATAAMMASITAAKADPFGAIALLDAELGLASAAAFDHEPNAALPFLGVPTLAKDLGGPFAGIPMRAGSRTLTDDPATDSDLAQRFRSSGLCVFGSTTAPEFGLALSSEPAVGSICRNPLDPTRTAGGSSGGAAAAVAAGIVAIAHATDAGGSIRVPAAIVAMLANLHPIGVIAAALFTATMFVGADSMGRALGIPSYIADVTVSLSLLTMLVSIFFTQYRIQR